MGSCLSVNSVPAAPQGLPDCVVQVTNESFEEAAAVGARSFAGTPKSEPEWSCNWVLGPDLDGKYDDPRREKALLFFMRIYLRFCMSYGGIVLAARKDDGSIGAVLMAWRFANGNRPAGTLLEVWRYLCNIKELGMPSTLSSIPGFSKRLMALVGVLLKSHEAHASGNHWYVQLMAVDPGSQGLGFCGKLMRLISSWADEDGFPCYLECSGERNPIIYGRFGYEVVQKYTLEAPKVKPYQNLFAMVRPPSDSKSV